MTESPNGGAPRRAGLRKALSIAAPVFYVGGTAANVIQILTAGRVTRGGLVIAGVIVYAASLQVAHHVGRVRRTGESAVLAAELAGSVEEMRLTRIVIEGSLGAYRPYRDERMIVFDVGEQSGGDGVEDYHITTPGHGPVVYWCQFEALSRGRGHVLSWKDIDLHVNRQPDSHHEAQQASVVKLQSEPAPRALITFAPPRDKVAWMAKYRSPGYWDPLRQGGQLFEWTPPSVGLDEEPGRRSPVEKVTFVLRVPRSLGTLEPSTTTLPTGVSFRVEPNGTEPVRKYVFTIDDIAALPGSSVSSVDPISWYLRLRPGRST